MKYPSNETFFFEYEAHRFREVFEFVSLNAKASGGRCALEFGVSPMDTSMPRTMKAPTVMKQRQLLRFVAISLFPKASPGVPGHSRVRHLGVRG